MLQEGWTALHCAAHAGYLDVAKLLVESGASAEVIIIVIMIIVVIIIIIVIIMPGILVLPNCLWTYPHSQIVKLPKKFNLKMAQFPKDNQ